MDKDHHPTSFGVFKPVGHVVISFPTAEGQEAAAAALVALGLGQEDISRYTPEQMLQQIDTDLQNASPLASVGNELNLIESHRVLAQSGYSWLVVHAPDDALARRVADAVKPLGAERAQHYGRFVIEELIEHPNDEPRVADSPARGLDSQTPSGLEVERVLRPAET